MSSACLNYLTNGGKELVIGGKLTVLEGAEVSGLGEGVIAFTQAEAVEDLSNSAELTDVITAFNGLIASLKAAGLMADE